MASYLIIFLLFLLQFIYLPIGTSFFEGSKVYVFELSSIVLFVIILFSRVKLQLKQYDKKYLAAFVIIFVISLFHIFTNWTPTVLFGNNFRLQGTILVWFLLLFSLISAKITIQKKYLPFLVFGTLLLQVFCSVYFIGLNTDRPIGSIGEPNALAATVLFLWPFIYFSSETTITKSWWLRIASFLLIIYIIVISGSRSGFIAFGVQLFFLLLHHFLPKKLLLTTLIASTLLFVSYIFPIVAHGDLYENRGEIWQSAVVAGINHPILGVGFGNVEYALHKANLQLHNHLPGYYVDSAHNLFLDWWLQGGIIGAGAFLFLLFQTGKSFVKQTKIRSLVLLLGIVAALSFNPASVVSLVALWWLIGQARAS